MGLKVSAMGRIDDVLGELDADFVSLRSLVEQIAEQNGATHQTAAALLYRVLSGSVVGAPKLQSRHPVYGIHDASVEDERRAVEVIQGAAKSHRWPLFITDLKMGRPRPEQCLGFNRDKIFPFVDNLLRHPIGHRKVASTKPEVADTLSPGVWPWGNHETADLRALAAAAERFWTLYDPSDPATAPTNEQVIAWLMAERELPERKAEIMASILRPRDLPSGPRKRK